MFTTLTIKTINVKKGDFIIVNGNSYYVTENASYINNAYQIPTQSEIYEQKKHTIEVYREG